MYEPKCGAGELAITTGLSTHARSAELQSLDRVSSLTGFRSHGFEVIPLAIGPPAACWSIINSRNRGNGRMQCDFPPMQPRVAASAKSASPTAGESSLPTAGSFSRAVAAKSLADACAKKDSRAGGRLYNGTLATCEAVRMVPLDDAIAHVPASLARPVVVKIDLEGARTGP